MLTSIELLSAGLSGGGVNPARALCAALVKQEFQGYEWIYFVGYLFSHHLGDVSPFIGSVFAALFYFAVKGVEFYTEWSLHEERCPRCGRVREDSENSPPMVDTQQGTPSQVPRLTYRCCYRCCGKIVFAKD